MSAFKLPVNPSPAPIRFNAEKEPIDIFTSRGEFIHRLEVGQAAQLKPNRFLLFFGIVSWGVKEFPSACPTCDGDGQVCNVCEKPGAVCKCPDSGLPTPMPCPACKGAPS